MLRLAPNVPILQRHYSEDTLDIYLIVAWSSGGGAKAPPAAAMLFPITFEKVVKG